MKKESNKSIVWLVIGLVIIIIGLFSYIAYDMMMDNKNKKQDAEKVITTESTTKKEKKVNEEREKIEYLSYFKGDTFEVFVSSLDLTNDNVSGKIVDTLDESVVYYFDVYMQDSTFYINNLYDVDDKVLYSDENKEKNANLTKLSLVDNDKKINLFFSTSDFNTGKSNYYLYQDDKLVYTSENYDNVYKLLSKLKTVAIYDNNKFELINLEGKILFDFEIEETNVIYPMIEEDTSNADKIVNIYAYDSNLTLSDIEQSKVDDYKKQNPNDSDEVIKNYLGYKYSYNVNTSNYEKENVIIGPVSDY